MKHLAKSLAVAVCLTLPVQGWSDTLSDIFQQALQNDPQLRAANAAYMAGRESAAIGRAGLLPQVGLTADYSEAESDDDNSNFVAFLGGNTSTKGNTETDTATFALSVRQPIFDMPAWYDYQQGKTVSEQARLQYQADQQALITRVTDAYFAVLNASENLTSAIAEEQAISRQLEQTRQRYEVGLLPITDVHEAQAVFDNAKVNTLILRGALQVAFESLEVLTGQQPGELAGLKSEFPATPPDSDREQWVQLALENNLQLKLSQAGRDAASQNATARKYEHLPKVSASLGYQDLDQDSSFSGSSGFGSNLGNLSNTPSSVAAETSTVALHLDAPIFTGGLVSSQRRQAQQQYIQADETANYTLRNTTNQARTAHLNVVTNAATVAARKQAITSAESALEATRAGYEVGTRNIVDLLFAERNLHQAERDYANARYQYIASSLTLKQVAGQLSPEDVHQLNAWLDTAAPVTRQLGQ